MVAPVLALSSAAAPAQEPAAAEQIAGAVLAAPDPLRAGATVLGYGGEHRSQDPLTLLRQGTGPLICVADDAASEGFHVACYHESLDPYMAIGRRLRADGRGRSEVMDARHLALRSGELRMPDRAALYSITAPEGAYDPATGEVAGSRRLAVVYVPYATGEELGLPTRPEGNAPWLMLAGTPWSHIMISR
jgi:hypothetical protein